MEKEIIKKDGKFYEVAVNEIEIDLSSLNEQLNALNNRKIERLAQIEDEFSSEINELKAKIAAINKLK